MPDCEYVSLILGPATQTAINERFKDTVVIARTCTKIYKFYNILADSCNCKL
jgi:hypothetical protein